MRYCIILFVIVIACRGQESPISVTEQPVGVTEVFVHKAISVYKKYISPIDGSNCKMLPSCSSYAKTAIKEHGTLGIFMSIDRINRCGHDLTIYPKQIKANPEFQLDVYYLDPVWKKIGMTIR